ncbi:MAG: redoxin domain-containing protein [Planctomycetes bacterium]|nr:redoxin domain-containing protein [Planctomycetota bacterium]
MKRRWLLTACCLALWCGGCRSAGLALYDMRGNQWVYPYFIDQPMVLAFWNTEELQCIEDLEGMKTLAVREGPIHLVSVCSSADRLKINLWVQKENVRFTVIHDPDLKLANRLGVKFFPTYIFFDLHGREIDRSLTIRTIQNWFDRPRHIERAVGEG